MNTKYFFHRLGKMFTSNRAKSSAACKHIGVCAETHIATIEAEVFIQFENFAIPSAGNTLRILY